MRLYRVTFTMNDDYRPKEQGIRSVNLVVEAADQFTALSAAWEKLAVLQLPEPKAFDATRCDKD